MQHVSGGMKDMGMDMDMAIRVWVVTPGYGGLFLGSDNSSFRRCSRGL